jgi:type II secretory pathway component GspD/PulD (secretin)
MPYTNNWNNDHSLTNIKNFQRDTQISNYGFTMSIVPSICKDTTTLAINMQNTSLIGFTENANGAAGAARTMTSEVNTTVMVNNQNKQFIIGGLEKTARVRSVSKVPWLGSLPLLGFIFSSESEVTKKSQLVAVVECEQQTPAQVMHPDFADAVKVIDKDHEDVGKGNSYGFDQFLLDKEKTSLEKLP